MGSCDATGPRPWKVTGGDKELKDLTRYVDSDGTASRTALDFSRHSTDYFGVCLDHIAVGLGSICTCGEIASVSMTTRSCSCAGIGVASVQGMVGGRTSERKAARKADGGRVASGSGSL